MLWHTPTVDLLSLYVPSIQTLSYSGVSTGEAVYTGHATANWAGQVKEAVVMMEVNSVATPSILLQLKTTVWTLYEFMVMFAGLPGEGSWKKTVLCKRRRRG